MILYFLILMSLAKENVVYQKQTEIDFDEIDITGEMIKPQGILSKDKQIVKFNPLIELRTDWDLEMIQSVSEIK